MVYIVHGATGAQGSPVLSAIVVAGAQATGLTRNADTVLPGATTLVADLASAESLEQAYRGAEGVFVHLPVAPEEALRPLVKNILKALQSAAPQRVVVSTSGTPLDSEQGRNSALGSLVAGVAESGLSYAVIEPRLFFENLLLPPVFEAARTQGVLRYPVRENIPISWASHLDIADLAAALLVKNREVTGAVGVGQSPGITGKDLAAGFSAHFGHEVVFESVLPADFGKGIAPLLGEAAAAPVVALYQSLQEAPAHVIAEDTSAQQLLGLVPRSPQQWLTDLNI